MPRVRKIRPGHKIAKLLIQNPGPVSVDQIRQMMEADPELRGTIYKLSGYVNDIRVYDGGEVIMTKNGRRADCYQLKNAHLFNPNTGQRYSETELQKLRDSCFPTDIQLGAMNEMALQQEIAEILAEEQPVASPVIEEEKQEEKPKPVPKKSAAKKAAIKKPTKKSEKVS